MRILSIKGAEYVIIRNNKFIFHYFFQVQFSCSIVNVTTREVVYTWLANPAKKLRTCNVEVSRAARSTRLREMSSPLRARTKRTRRVPRWSSLPKMTEAASAF